MKHESEEEEDCVDNSLALVPYNAEKKVMNAREALDVLREVREKIEMERRSRRNHVMMIRVGPCC